MPASPVAGRPHLGGLEAEAGAVRPPARREATRRVGHSRGAAQALGSALGGGGGAEGGAEGQDGAAAVGTEEEGPPRLHGRLGRGGLDQGAHGVHVDVGLREMRPVDLGVGGGVVGAGGDARGVGLAGDGAPARGCGRREQWR